MCRRQKRSPMLLLLLMCSEAHKGRRAERGLLLLSASASARRIDQGKAALVGNRFSDGRRGYVHSAAGTLAAHRDPTASPTFRHCYCVWAPFCRHRRRPVESSTQPGQQLVRTQRPAGRRPRPSTRPPPRPPAPGRAWRDLRCPASPLMQHACFLNHH